MVLLECLRGSASSIPASSIDDIINDEENAGVDGLVISISFADEEAAARGEGEAKMATVGRASAASRTSIHTAAVRTIFLFFLFSLFFLFFEDRTAPRQRGLSRKVVSGKGLKQKSELLSKCPFFFCMFLFFLSHDGKRH